MKKAKRLISLALSIVMALTLLTACGNGDNADNVDRDTLTVAMMAKINSLDPINAVSSSDYYVFNCIFSTLIDFDANDEVYCDLAESYRVEDDGLTHIFSLREGVTFHDGTLLTAEDVVFSIESCRNNPYRSTYFSCVASVEANGNDIVIRLTENTGNILLGLANAYIVPKAQYESLGAEGFGQVLNGSGAFALESYDEATGAFVLTRNDAYYRDAAKIKTIDIRVISNQSTAAIALEKGDINWTFANGSTQDSLVGNDGVVCEMSPINTQFWLFFNTTATPFDNVKLRQAMACAISTEMAALASGSGISNTTPWSSVWGEVPEYENRITYDPDYAKQLLSEAGYPDGVDIGNFLLQSAQSDVGAQIQADLAAVGIRCELQTADINTWVSQFVSKNYTMTICSSSGYDKVEAFDHWFRSTSSENYSAYTGADALLDALSAADESERDARVLDLLNLVATDVPCLPLYDVSMGSAYTKGLVLEAGALRSTTLDFSTAYWAD